MKSILPIIVQPTGGLCNRLRTIASATELAKRMNRKMIVLWIQDHTLNAPFYSLFNTLPFIVINSKQGSLIQKTIWNICKISGYTFFDDTWVYENARGKDYNLWKNMIENSMPFIVSSCDIFKNVGDYSIFAVSNHIKNMLVKKGDESKMIGIHIRRTDNEMAIRYSPTSLFVQKIHEEIEKNPKVMFYLATDDPLEEELIISKFPNKIIVHKKRSLDRNNPMAIEDAVVDLANLSHCEKLYGSYWSSFSDVASLWGGVTKEVLKTSSVTD